MKTHNQKTNEDYDVAWGTRRENSVFNNDSEDEHVYENASFTTDGPQFTSYDIDDPDSDGLYDIPVFNKPTTVPTQTESVIPVVSIPNIPNQTGAATKEPRKPLDRKTKVYMYISHFLSAWGDRMWSFGVGLFLINLDPESLRLTAIYGFSSGGAVLLFGPLLGDWVDNSPRLTAARLSLIVQNLSVVVSAVVVFLVFWYKSEIENYWPDKGLLQLCYAFIIFITIISNLASIANTIAVEKDWLVEICGSDKDLLATMSATMRCIDQTSLILAPALTGQIMAFTALAYGAIFIAGWNLLSVVIEYYLLWKVFVSVPSLRNKMYKTKNDTENNIPYNIDEETQPLINKRRNSNAPIQKQSYVVDKKDNEMNGEVRKISKSGDMGNSSEGCCTSCLRKTFRSFITLYVGWKTYKNYDVAFAGIGLAFLFMTVLGFDNITVGYAVLQGLNESVVGILMAVGAGAGILGTIAYPVIRRHIGLRRTGFVGLSSQILMLSACVAAVWAPGSPFDPYYLFRTSSENQTSVVDNGNNSKIGNLSTNNFTIPLLIGTTTIFNSTATTNEMFYNISTNSTIPLDDTGQNSYISIGLLMGGIVAARFGLWMADLTISQLFLETVIDTERGIVNGVQNSLNQLMNMLKFLLVILVPQPELFGYLILLSFAFVCSGWIFYAKYSITARGHLCHFGNTLKCCRT